ncbi:MAG: GAF domain-containing protein [Cytophagales bacterium]|nr:GAF domain-containing protein [Bernardetiaceae bacterium]MDW8204241.1 GAF domain-containing protein [Cytophagales bacterium]
MTRSELYTNKDREAQMDSHTDVRLLAEIGKKIIAELDLERVIEVIFESLSSLMDVAIFDIGIYNQATQQLEFPGGIEEGEKLPFHTYSTITDKHRLAVHCFLNQQEIYINDFYKEYNQYIPNAPVPTPILGKNANSIIYLPLVCKNQTIGTITVQSFQYNAYTPYHVELLRNLAVYIAIAMENASTYEEIEKQKELIEMQNRVLNEQKTALEQAYQNIQLLGQLGQQITSSLDIETVTERIHESLNTLMDASVFWIGTYNREKNALEFVGGKECGKTLPYFELDMADENRLAAYCFNNKAEVWLNDYPNEYHKYTKKFAGAIMGEIPLSIIYMPLMAKDTCIGVVTVQSFQKSAYTENHLHLLRSLAVYIAIAIENASLYRDVENKVKERTIEVVKQKEELEESHAQIEKAYQNVKLLGEIGLQITTELSTDKIIEKVYENVNALMDATAFGIGILSESRAKIEFRGAMERGQKLPTFYHSMNDDKRFSVWAIKNRREVFINDYSKEYNKYVKEVQPPAAGEDPESMIYLPLISKDVVIGVITVQSFRKNAYDEYSLNILRSLAVFIANAIENAEAYRKIEDQNQDIRRTNDKMTASINYARRIQQAMLPDKAAIQTVLPDSFIFFRPRDIVSGDFYWFLEKENKIFIAAVDCTGHGVPGAFMSMIGNDFLNEIVSLLHIESPELILKELHAHVRKALKQSETDNRDGMDVALCVIDRQRRVLEYAGAKSPLIYIRHDQPQTVYHIKGDRIPIGGMQKEPSRVFTKHIIPIQAPTSFYIFSDGLQDQFGGEQGLKYSIGRLKKFFAQNYHLPMEQQRRQLRFELMEWMQHERQIDDILVMGFKVE